ncbi:endothelin-converting enzyme 1 [Plakobranchus ocellatus]|uniref:Endothelin-converting enzyme 1 n=1 Tax=Plakobranchus ocellatus TaxID=259542 RepID=A0AAV3Y666_9GAST|nr:endothelin-converting enzyme 1 [Plakobranchus ocellatus]
MIDSKETALIDSSPTSPAAPARLRARIMASGYRYQMLDGKNIDGFELELREESKPNQSAPYLKAIAIVLGLVAMALLVALVFVIAQQSREDDFQVCITAECVSTSAAILSRMDSEIHPCEDMYHLACGKWINNTMLPSGFSRLSMLGQISSRNQVKMRKLLESDGTLLGNNNSTAVNKLKIWYRTCMDRDTIEQQGHDRLLEMMVELGFWTVSPPPQGQLPWNRDQWSLQDALVKTHKLFGSSLFDISIEKDPTEENENILMFTQDGLTLSYKNEYKDKSNNFKKAFIAFAVQVGTLLGGDADNVSAKMEQVYEFEKNLSEIFVPREKLIDPLQIYKKFSLLQFQEMLGDWLNIKSYLKEIFYGREFSNDTDIIVTTPAYFSQLGQVVNATDKETLANYVIWNIVQSMLEYLPDDFRQASLLLTQAENGVSSLPERWIRCLREARSAVGFASSALFVENYFSPQSKIKVDNVLEQVKLQFISNLDSVDWLDEVTRLRLVDKAKAVSSLVGYPDWILQAENLDHRYEKLTVKEGDLFNNNLHLISYLFNRTLEKYDKKPDPEEWHFFPDIVNAFYNPLYNNIVMPAGILQPPVYSPDYPE